MSIFTSIKSRVSIFDVINEYTSLKKIGHYWKSRCPFHHEKTASFTVSPHKEIFYCFGCHEGGDVISFIAKIENCTPLESARLLAERYNIELPDSIEFTQHNAEEKQQYYHICKVVALWCNQQLHKHPSIMQYLQQREIAQKQIDYFTLGFFPGGPSAIKQCITALKKGLILAKDLLNANIIAQGKTTLYSPFEDRIIFPIKDSVGRFCGFGGRVYKPQDTRPKYYNSRENDFFCKGSILFGFDNAKKSIQKNGIVFLVEGYTDCIAMVQHGYPNTVATLGTACTINHLKLLSRHANYVYLLYDNDTAGQKAILRLTHLCWQANMELKVVQLPNGQDPASFLAAQNQLDTRIDQAQDIFTFFMESLGKGFSIMPLHEKVARIHRLIETIQSVDDPLKQDILLQAAARIFDMPFESLKRAFRDQNRHSFAPRSDHASQTPQASPHTPEPSNLEKRLFCAIMNNVDLLGMQNDNYIIDQLSSPLDKILKKLQKMKTSDSSFDFSHFFDTLSQDEKQYASKLLLKNEERIDRASYENLIRQFQKQQWKRITRSISTQLEQARIEGNDQEVQRILRDYNTLKQKVVSAIGHTTTKEEGN